MKNIRILSESFHFLVVKFSVYLNRHVFVMDTSMHRKTRKPGHSKVSTKEIRDAGQIVLLGRLVRAFSVRIVFACLKTLFRCLGLDVSSWRETKK